MVMYMKPEPKTEQFEANEITATLIDDDEIEFNVTITYDYHLYFSPWENETVVVGYEYKVEGEPRISKKDLSYWVEDEIRTAEPRTVTFNI